MRSRVFPTNDQGKGLTHGHGLGTCGCELAQARTRHAGTIIPAVLPTDVRV
jgi:hypothetical protein